MPVFDYECKKCGWKDEDVIERRGDYGRECKSCGTPMVKRIAPFCPIFVGAGWTKKFYSTNGKF